ncbi:MULTISPECIES: cation diffusion facilitator family transporter [Microbacterium]|uniref:Cobalt-zinc-cadmium efflux system protein n=1 Tax=Microbacterium hydrocarbonoxydans TaxID=273678 RepID=A0A1H4RJX4_9MICO|nr:MULTISPECIES: cation diffusion facilitator family transporter [Microbacterium]AKV87250.1 cation transporter [Microbacterium sp. CGR1]AQY00320.1 cation transporter [Microbacterium foliorum]KIP93768.1 cation transporter [Microbacterium sp. MEJ108Y]KRD52167.1 cation transporter [Microbacterium sp. Root280D1]MBC6493470.1 cation transporter [Microbacterium sp. 4-7]
MTDTGHSHGIGDATPRNRLVIAFAITSSVFIVEVIGAIITGSLALLVDAAHMLTDVVGLAMAVTAAHLMNRPPTPKYTFGLRRTEVLGALAQATLLLGVGIFALVEGVRRLFEPPEIASGSLLFFGIVGLVANIASMLVLFSGRGRNLNMRAAFLEVVNDALGSVGVIASAILIAVFGWYQADAVAGVLIALLIIPRTLILLRASGRVLLESTPAGLDLEDVRRHILALPHVVAVHDLHATQVSTDLPTLTAHVVVDDTVTMEASAALLTSLQQCVNEHFAVSIEHSTFQIEPESHPGEHDTHA